MGFSGPEKNQVLAGSLQKPFLGDSFHLSILPNILQIPILSDHERKAKNSQGFGLVQGTSSCFLRPLNATLFFFLAPPHSSVSYLPPPSSSLPVVKSEQLCPATNRPKKKKKRSRKQRCRVPRSEARWRGLSDPARTLPERPPPAPSQSAPQSRIPGLERRPSPGELRGCSRLPSQLLPTPPHPRQALRPGLQSRLSSGLHFYCLSVPGFLLPLWKGVPGPQAWHLPFHREGKMCIWGPRSPASPAAATSRPLLTIHKLCLKLFPSY